VCYGLCYEGLEVEERNCEAGRRGISRQVAFHSSPTLCRKEHAGALPSYTEGSSPGGEVLLPIILTLEFLSEACTCMHEVG
jgi:hypothetical protein